VAEDDSDHSEDYTSDTEEKSKRVFDNLIHGTEMTFNLFKLTPHVNEDKDLDVESDDQVFFRELSMLRDMKNKKASKAEELPVVDAHRSEPSLMLSSHAPTFMIPTDAPGNST
jgi:hypothetical protein